ncbi:hypothetical protein [Gloeomargarita lithophora]|uniref:hypothetical protein n=1 Tax=Gloeomargarita lithophora TaxID=1188228 RepID=UPI0008F8A41C|nr:hypothetical protein [Gloeomargarita lithophora]
MQQWFLTLGTAAMVWATLTTAAFAHGRTFIRPHRGYYPKYVYPQRSVRSGRYFAPTYAPKTHRRVILVRPQRYYRYY